MPAKALKLGHYPRLAIVESADSPAVTPSGKPVLSCEVCRLTAKEVASGWDRLRSAPSIDDPTRRAPAPIPNSTKSHNLRALLLVRRRPAGRELRLDAAVPRLDHV